MVLASITVTAMGTFWSGRALACFSATITSSSSDGGCCSSDSDGGACWANTMREPAVARSTSGALTSVDFLRLTIKTKTPLVEIPSTGVPAMARAATVTGGGPRQWATGYVPEMAAKGRGARECESRLRLADEHPAADPSTRVVLPDG